MKTAFIPVKVKLEEPVIKLLFFRALQKSMKSDFPAFDTVQDYTPLISGKAVSRGSVGR
jgi:hypothetical protein